MTKRSLLRMIVAAMSLGSLAFVIVLFGQALSPPSHLPKATLEIPVQSIEPGSGKLFVLENSRRIEARQYTRLENGKGFLVLRDTNKEYYLYWVPIWEGKILMPYKAWGQHEGTCNELNIGRSHFGEQTIYCKNTEWPEFLTNQWYWSFDGKNFGDDLPDLTPIRFRIISGVMHAYWH